MNQAIIGMTVLDHAADLPLPAYETTGSAGMDLRAAIDAPVLIEPGEWVRIPTGLCMELPHDLEAQIRPRSGLAFKHAVTCLNAPGTIDSDYRGEVGVLLINHGKQAFQVERGMRIAQMVIAPVHHGKIEFRTDLSSTSRDSGGFGSTGLT